MREGIGSTFIYNIIAIFILLVFIFLGGAVSYTKGFKTNTIVANAIEKYEGYNTLAQSEINIGLNNFGYQLSVDVTCPTRDGLQALKQGKDAKYRYCVYQQDLGSNYYIYGVVTYISIELPFIGKTMQIPIYSQTKRVYNFN